MDVNLIYPIKWEHQIFNDNNDLQRYLKYLFCCSEDYSTNKERELNSYLRRDLDSQRLSKFGLMSQTEQKYKNFRDSFWEYLKNEKNILEETHHIAYLLTIGSKVVTNIVRKSTSENNTLKTTIPHTLLDRLIDEFFDSDEDLLFSKISHSINDKEKKIVAITDLSIEERKLVEKRIHGTLNMHEYREVLISMSHHDENNLPYHIHRLIKIEK